MFDLKRGVPPRGEAIQQFGTTRATSPKRRVEQGRDIA
jgi:hypothetical protein